MDIGKYREKFESDDTLGESSKIWIEELIHETDKLLKENKRLRRLLLNASSSKPRMSSKLRDALYE